MAAHVENYSDSDSENHERRGASSPERLEVPPVIHINSGRDWHAGRHELPNIQIPHARPESSRHYIPRPRDHNFRPPSPPPAFNFTTARRRDNHNIPAPNIHHIRSKRARPETTTRFTYSRSADYQRHVDYPDPDGAYRIFPARDPRLAIPGPANALNTAASYYESGFADAAWRSKKLERLGLRPAPPLDPEWRPTEIPLLLCFVTIKGRPIFAQPVAEYQTERFDEDFAQFVHQQYGRIVSRSELAGYFGLRFKTIGAVEFQTWAKLPTSRWRLVEVDSIPNTATRTNMSHFAYQLRHPYPGATRWASKVDELLIKAAHIHTSPVDNGVYNFRLHIIEIIDAWAMYVALFGAILLSTTGGLIYGFLRHDMSGGITIAGYVITCLALALALLAAADFIGMETPDSFVANDIFVNGLEVDDREFQ